MFPVCSRPEVNPKCLQREILNASTLLLTLLSLSLMALGSKADQVTLKNGDRLSGSVVKTDDDAKTLLIKTELAGDVTIPWDAVTGIVSSQPPTSLFRTGA
jgi:hypothetical protein